MHGATVKILPRTVSELYLNRALYSNNKLDMFYRRINQGLTNLGHMINR
jgi:hypothetical protein